MPRKMFALEKGGPKRLEIAWQGAWKDLTMRLDGNPVGSIAGMQELWGGQEFVLPDGSTLRVRLVTHWLKGGLYLLRDGVPLPGSASDPEAGLRGAYTIIWLLAVLRLVGSMFVLAVPEYPQQFALYLGISGLAYLVFGWLVRRRAIAALLISVVAYSLEMVVGALWVTTMGWAHLPGACGGVLVAFLFLLPMIRGYNAARAARKG